MSFIPCELHCHTVHSDGDFLVNQLQLCAKKHKLSAIALTDHNTFSGYSQLDDSIIPTIRGIEWTTYFGHMLVLGAKEIIDWRDAIPDNIDEKISQVKAVQGIVGIAHPYQIGSPICTGGRWEFNVNAWENVSYIEIWHEDIFNNQKENIPATTFWKSLLDKGYKIAAAYGRDWHREGKGNFGCTYLNVDGEITEKKLLQAIECGKAVVSSGVKFFFHIDNDYQIGDTVPAGKHCFSFHISNIEGKAIQCDESIEIEYKSIKIITNGNNNVSTISAENDKAEVELKAGNWYICELWGSVNQKELPLAITSPIYCEY